MNFCQTRVRLVQSGVALAVVALVAGCGNNYQPVVTPTNPPGPAPQPQSWVVVVSAPPTPASGVVPPGVATIIDYSGDSIKAQVDIGPGPAAFTLDAAGANGFTINSDKTITNFPVSSTQDNQVLYTTLLATAMPLNLFSPASGLWAADLCGTTPPSTSCESVVDVFTGSPETSLPSIPLATPTPVMVMGPGTNGQRFFAISQNISSPTGVECNTPPFSAVTSNGTATPIEANYSTDTTIPLGKCPVYAVESSDSKRLFVLNRGSDTVTVINAVDDALDGVFDAHGNCVPFISQTGQTVTCHPTLPLSTTAVTATGISPPNGIAGMTATAGPVYAEYNAATSQLIVANYDGGTISIIDVSLDQYGNDSQTFGTTFTVPVGNHPASVTALADFSRAFTANQTDQTVTVVNLSSHTVEKTLPVTGHPRTVVSTQNSLYDKVYVASPDSPYLTILESTGTETDIEDITLLLNAGNLVDVRVSTQIGSGANSNILSRIPGYGQPCNLPGAPAEASLAACQTLP